MFDLRFCYLYLDNHSFTLKKNNNILLLVNIYEQIFVLLKLFFDQNIL